MKMSIPFQKIVLGVFKWILLKVWTNTYSMKYHDLPILYHRGPAEVLTAAKLCLPHLTRYGLRQVYFKWGSNNVVYLSFSRRWLQFHTQEKASGCCLPEPRVLRSGTRSGFSDPRTIRWFGGFFEPRTGKWHSFGHALPVSSLQVGIGWEDGECFG